MSISFHKATHIDNSAKTTFFTNQEALGDAEDWFTSNLSLNHFSFTKSCTQSLELSFLVLNLPIGSEVILPSYAFVSLANAVVNLGLRCVFVDCEKDTMNISSEAIRQAITPKTKAIISINYGGISCDYDSIKSICKKHDLFLIEDNAHGIKGKYKDQFLGSFGDISVFSFDHLKNFTCYQGGGIAINNSQLLNKFYIASEFGTNRMDKLEGKVNFYEWIGRGTNAKIAAPLLSILMSQLEHSDNIISKFNENWCHYQSKLQELDKTGKISLAKIPEYAHHNAHMFWIKTRNLEERSSLIEFLAKKKIPSSSHYFPLHQSQYGKEYAEFTGPDINTTSESEKILRLPLYYELDTDEIDVIVSAIYDFYKL